MKVGVVIPVLRYFEGACELLASVVTEHEWTPYVLPQWRAQVPLAKAWNDGARRAFAEGCDYALVCNDDIMFAPCAIDNMIKDLERLRKSDQVVMVTPNNIMAQLPHKYDVLTYTPPSDPFTWSEHPNFSCFLIKPEYFDLVGTFDENFAPAWWEDNDAHYRAKLLGYKLVCTTSAPTVHIGGVSTVMMGPSINSQASHDYYLRKWGSVHRNLDEAFKTPYNDPKLTPRDWVLGR